MGNGSTWGGFSSQHPFVTNDDGSRSNVRLASGETEGKNYVFPTMIGGKEYSMDDAWNMAMKDRGSLPWFLTQEDAERWIQMNHSKIQANGLWQR